MENLGLPLLGSTTVRDMAGMGVDAVLFNPISNQTYLNIDTGTRIPAALGGGINARAQFLDAGKGLEDAALDKYEFMRDTYLQRRNSLVHNGNVPKNDE